MCELFALSARAPATVRLSLEEFSRHGGLSGAHKDGWGLAWYEGRDVHLVRENVPAAGSACVRFIQEHPFSSTLVLSHIRKATQGGRTLANCQPFARELGGRMHVFAHNGHLEGGHLRAVAQLGACRPVGDTDSEHAFCWLLERLQPLWRERRSPPALAERLGLLADFALTLRALGPANFLYSDGDALFAHGDRRTQADGAIRPPGLQVLQRSCAGESAALGAEGLAVDAGSARGQEVLLAASVPLTGEAGWRPLARGELLAAREGRVVSVATAAA